MPGFKNISETAMGRDCSTYSRRQFIIASSLVWFPFRWLAAIKDDEAYFQHGVASGDPLQNQVIIWTRVTATEYFTKVVAWQVAADNEFRQIVGDGRYSLSAGKDYTVKIDVTGLKPGRTYYYRFRYKDQYSPVGVTCTLPEELYDGAFSIAVVSCNNWEDGYFNAFRFLARKKEVDMVLHLGDYIYEYSAGQYNNPAVKGRVNSPLHEIVTLQDYRQRYAQYRTDPDLQELHAAKPFIMIWDDHEMANDSYKDGAKNHQPEEGVWANRRAAAVQAYLEWLPVRAADVKGMQRKISIGNDMDLFLVDERLQGRTRQLDVSDKAFNNEDRSMLGSEQYQWLEQQLKNSRATWKLIGNEVMFSGYTVLEGYKSPKYNDWWLGYPYERNKLIAFLGQEHPGNVIFLTGDHHESFVLALHQEKEYAKYTHAYTEKPLAWELLTPSITSKNADRLTNEEIERTEKMLRLPEVNPHLVYADIKNHGYFIATISKEQFAATYYFTNTVISREAKEYKAASFTIDAATFNISKE